MKNKMFMLAVLLIIALNGFCTKKVCFVNNRADANICINVVSSRSMADYVIVKTDNPTVSGDNVWFITDMAFAELKIYVSNTPERIKVFFTEKHDGTTSTNKPSIPATKKRP